MIFSALVIRNQVGLVVPLRLDIVRRGSWGHCAPCTFRDMVLDERQAGSHNEESHFARQKFGLRAFKQAIPAAECNGLLRHP